jgi:hypothetical protein
MVRNYLPGLITREHRQTVKRARDVYRPRSVRQSFPLRIAVKRCTRRARR